MSFKVLKIGDQEWVARVMGLGSNRRDIHLDQRMLAPYFLAYRNICGLALTVDDKNNGEWVVQPLLINSQQELRHAYNFGGPVGSQPCLTSADCMKEHMEGVDNWCHKYGVKSQYATLIPWLVSEQLRLMAPTQVEPQYIKESVYVDVHNIDVRKTSRHAANKAQGAGVEVVSYPLIPPNIEMFFAMYNFTMDRVGAKDHFRFSFEWFQGFAKYVKPELLVTIFEGKVQSACLIAYSQQYPVAYYHFAASYNRIPTLGINHMLVLAACEFVKSKNMKYLYLGGGTTPDTHDNLLIFKSGFSKLRFPVYQYQRMHEVNHDQYELKCKPIIPGNNGMCAPQNQPNQE